MWLAAFLIEKNAKYWKNWLLFWNFGIKCCITWSKLTQIMWFFYNSSIFHLIYQFTKFYFFRKYIPAMKTMNESMNESMNEWMKKMAVTWVDKNESFFKRTHTLPGINESYLLATSNCYHFAGSIVKVLEQEFEIQSTVKNSKAGKWYNLDIVSLKEWNIASIRERYKANVMAFVSFIPIFK